MERVTEQLWQQELYGAAVSAPAHDPAESDN